MIWFLSLCIIIRFTMFVEELCRLDSGFLGYFLLLGSRVWPSGVDKAPPPSTPKRPGFPPNAVDTKIFCVFFRDVLRSSARRQYYGSQLLDMEVTLLTMGIRLLSRG